MRKVFFWIIKAFKRILALSYKLPLRLWFQYPKWHDLTLMECSYARLIIAHLNRRVRREKVLEIGCGLGNILRNLKYNQKVGVDRDRNVINALSFFLKFSFLDNKTDLIHGDIKSVKNLDTSDAIILVNWIHEIDPITLKGYLSKLFDDYLNCGGEIIFDTVSQ